MPILLRIPWGGGKASLDPSKLDSVLAGNTWRKIARASEEGIASTIWNVGDEIDVVLSGDYKGSITMQIAGFDHDDLVAGGKAGITFLSKQIVAGPAKLAQGTTNGDWRATTAYRETLPKIKASLPDGIQRYIKMILKICGNGTYSATYTTEDDVFVPSISELMPRGDTRIESSMQSREPYDGKIYDIFKGSTDVRKNVMGGGVGSWWTRSGYSTNFMYVDANGYVNRNTASYSHNICFGFCI